MGSILILEDEPLIALDLKFACDDAGLASITAGDSATARAVIERETVSGAVLDVNLGRGETCQAIAELLRSRSIPFVLNTGDLDRAGELLRQMGAPIIAKPSAADEVIERLRELL